MNDTVVKHVTVTLRTEDAEPILREAAFTAAKFSSYVDYITNRTYNAPSRGFREKLVDAKARWQKRFLKAKRLVEAFGVEYEQVSEGETLSVYIPEKVLKSHIVKVGGLLQYRHIDKSKPDYKNPMPSYRGGVHEEACRQAAERVVVRWRETLSESARPRVGWAMAVTRV